MEEMDASVKGPISASGFGCTSRVAEAKLSLQDKMLFPSQETTAQVENL